MYSIPNLLQGAAFAQATIIGIIPTLCVFNVSTSPGTVNVL